MEGYEIELRGDDGQPVADGEIGDLYIRGPSAALLYWGNREKSCETFRGAWTKSGDKYVRDKEGYYTYRSQRRHAQGGRQYVSPFEVEGTLVQHPAVLEAAVVGVPDANGLTRTKAFVVLKPGRDADALGHELQTFIKERLAPHKYPRAIEFIDELPKTATGKIQRFRLREREGARARDEGRSRRRPVRRHRLGRVDRSDRVRMDRQRATGAPQPPARRVPARGLGSLAMWKNSRAGCAMQRTCGVWYSPTGLWPVDAASRGRTLGRRLPPSPGVGAAPGVFRCVGPRHLRLATVAARTQRRRIDRPALRLAFPRSVAGLILLAPIFSSSRSA